MKANSLRTRSTALARSLSKMALPMKANFSLAPPMAKESSLMLMDLSTTVTSKKARDQDGVSSQQQMEAFLRENSWTIR